MQPVPPSIPSPIPAQKPPAPPRRRARLTLPLALIVIAIGVAVLSSAGFVVVSALEEQDTFCVSCHTAPEITYFNRAYFALDNPAQPIPDLSTAHYTALQKQGKDFQCIACHRGDGSFSHRVSTMALAAYDTLIYLAGRENPAIEKQNTKTGWLANASCVGCHTESLLKLDGINNHFHTYLPQAREALDKGGPLTIGEALAAARAQTGESGPPTLETIQVSTSCSGCHQAHKAQVGGANRFFMDTDLRNAACVDCHILAKQGPQTVRELAGE